VPLVAAAKQPTVLIGLPQDPEGLSCVDLDFEAAGRLAVRHLAGAGHTDVALIGSPPEVLQRHTSYAERLMRGLRSQAKLSGVTVEVEACDSSPSGAASAVDTLLATAPDTTGIIVHNEGALPHVLSRLAERGIVVGTDMSVVAVCPTDVALSQRIPMTSIDLPAEGIGKVAVDMVMARLEGEHPSETRLLAPVLTERASSVSGPSDPLD
jgi:DNA-binding LacI/PurR family transcriptional regulator